MPLTNLDMYKAYCQSIPHPSYGNTQTTIHLHRSYDMPSRPVSRLRCTGLALPDLRLSQSSLSTTFPCVRHTVQGSIDSDICSPSCINCSCVPPIHPSTPLRLPALPGQYGAVPLKYAAHAGPATEAPAGAYCCTIRILGWQFKICAITNACHQGGVGGPFAASPTV